VFDHGDLSVAGEAG